MKKQFFITLCFITMHNYTMKIEQSFPDETLASIIQYSLPKLNLYYHQKPTDINEDKDNLTQAKNNLEQYITTTMKLRSISQRFNTIITKNIVTWLNFNQHGINAFLLRSTQANIPYFMKIAITHNGHPNCVDAPNGNTPLLYATANNDYLSCKFLLEKGASINMKLQPPRAFGYGYNPGIWPIHIAIGKENLTLVTLFIKHGSQLDFSNFNAENLLSCAAKKIITLFFAPSFKLVLIQITTIIGQKMTLNALLKPQKNFK